MSYDVWISVIACLSGLWGLIVTFWAPNTLRKKVLCILPFVALATVGILLVQAQSKQKDRAEQLIREAQERTQDSLARSEKEVIRIQEGLKTVQVLLATPSGTPDAKVVAANAVLASLQSQFTDTGTSLTTQRSIVATSFETNEKGNGYVELTEISTGQKVTLTVGDRPPDGKCVTGSLYMVSTGGVGSSLFLCEAGSWSGMRAASASSSHISLWAILIPSIAAVLSFLLMMIHRRNMLETVRPELVLRGWHREPCNNGEPDHERVVFKQIQNVGRGAALQVRCGLFQTSEDKPTVVLGTLRVPVIATDEETEVIGEITLYWRNIGADHVAVPLSIFCFDTRGAQYETRYELLIVPLRPDIVTEPIEPSAPGVMLGSRRVFITSVWQNKWTAYGTQLRTKISSIGSTT